MALNLVTFSTLVFAESEESLVRSFMAYSRPIERRCPKCGTLVAKAPVPAGPYALDPGMITGPGESWAEGPCALKVGEKTRH